jgi:acyl-CoA thioester hydrolase
VSSVFPPMDPVKSRSVHEVRVRFCETDLMGIVHHGSYVLYCEAGRVEWLRKRGVTYADWAASGVHLPVVEVSLKYIAPARFDDVLSVETSLLELRTVSLKFGYVIRRGESRIAEGWTRLGCIDGDHKLYRIPEPMRCVLLAGEGC